MFCNALHFNQAIESWDVAAVRDMSSMFYWSKILQQAYRILECFKCHEHEGDVLTTLHTSTKPLNRGM